MAIVVTQDQKDNVGTGVSSITIATVEPTGDDRLLIVSGGNSDATPTTLTSITFGATAVGVENWNEQITTYVRHFCKHLVAPAAESRTVTITVGGNQGEIVCGAVSFSGVDQATAVDGVTTSNGTATTVNLVVTSEIGDLVYDTVYAVASGGTSEDEGGTVRWDRLAFQTYVDVIAATEAGAASVTRGYSFGGSSGFSIGGMNINAAAAGGGGIVILRRRREGM